VRRSFVRAFGAGDFLLVDNQRMLFGRRVFDAASVQLLKRLRICWADCCASKQFPQKWQSIGFRDATGKRQHE
jgi:hypothetical protein